MYELRSARFLEAARELQSWIVVSGDDRANIIDEDVIELDYDPDELSEFLEPDPLVPRADPGFKTRLRKELWWMLLTRLARRGRRSGCH